jgi:hypothetical protein
MIFFTPKTYSQSISLSLWVLIMISFIVSCNPVSTTLTVTPLITTPSLTSVTPESTITPISTATIQSLPLDITILKIDGVNTTAELEAESQIWVWRDKKGLIRRLLDPLTNHVLARTSANYDRLTYDIDLAFQWEVNLTNYVHYVAHTPFGPAYIQLLKSKYPQSFSQADENTGIIFRIIQGSLQDLQDQSLVNYSAELGIEKEMTFLKPIFIPATNEFILTLLLRTDYLTKKGAVNTYTDWMLNYCLNPEYPQNPSGSWGIELYKHPIK